MTIYEEVAISIIEKFEDLLESKGIEIPCEDKEEEQTRHNGENCEPIYGIEYWNLKNEITNIIADNKKWLIFESYFNK